jgi:hypothetical protein
MISNMTPDLSKGLVTYPFSDFGTGRSRVLSDRVN